MATILERLHDTLSTGLTPATAAPLLDDLGFLASSDLPDRPGPACLLVALRETPTLRHYDPEIVQYWTSEQGRGTRRMLTRLIPVSLESAFSWGPITISDRLRVTNDYLTFGGHLSVGIVGDVLVCVFQSPAPLLRCGGHSQAWDLGADSLGAYFGRVRTVVGRSATFERRVEQAHPVTRYAAFLVDTAERFGRSEALATVQGPLWDLVRAEIRRVRQLYPLDWQRGRDLVRESSLRLTA